MKSRTILATIGVVLSTAAPVLADTLHLADARHLARIVGHRLANAYRAEDWKLVGCYKTGHSTGRCVMRLYGVQGTDRNCTYAINVVASHHRTRSSYYADNCPAP